MGKVNRFFGPDEAGVLDNSVHGEAIKLEDLDESERRAVVGKTDALKRLLDTSDLAEFKIEVMFDKRKTNRGNFPGAMTVWRSGSALGGGGDDVLYPCPKDGCNGYVGFNDMAPMVGTAYCKSCCRVWKQSDLSEMRFYNIPAERWAEVIRKEFVRLGCRADIVMRTTTEKISDRTMKSLNTPKIGEELYTARVNRLNVVYKLSDLIHDTEGGSTLEARIVAFLQG